MTAKGGDATGNSCGIEAQDNLYEDGFTGNIEVSGGKLTATSGSSNSANYGLWAGWHTNVEVGKDGDLECRGNIAIGVDEGQLLGLGTIKGTINATNSLYKTEAGIWTMQGNVTIPEGKTLTIDKGETLTIPEGSTLTNKGTLTIVDGGKLINNGTLTVSEGATVTIDKGAGYTVNYAEESVTPQEGFEISKDNSEWGTDSLSVVPEGKLYVRFGASGSAVENTLSSRPVAPAGLTGVNETVDGEHDGKITGTTDSMEYKLSTNEGWTTCGTSIENLVSGTYYVRYKSTDTAFAGERAEVVIASGGGSTGGGSTTSSSNGNGGGNATTSSNGNGGGSTVVTPTTTPSTDETPTDEQTPVDDKTEETVTTPSGWTDGKKYDKDGNLYTNQFVMNDQGQKVYVGKDGTVVTNKFVTSKGKKVYVGKYGTVVTSKWVKVGKNYYYCTKTGTIATNRTLTYKGKKVKVDKTGKMVVVK